MDTEQGLYNWAVYDLPVEYTKPIMCDPNYLGEKYEGNFQLWYCYNI